MSRLGFGSFELFLLRSSSLSSLRYSFRFLTGPSERISCTISGSTGIFLNCLLLDNSGSSSSFFSLGCNGFLVVLFPCFFFFSLTTSNLTFGGIKFVSFCCVEKCVINLCTAKLHEILLVDQQVL